MLRATRFPISPLLLASSAMLAFAGCSRPSQPDTALRCYVGGTMRPVMEAFAAKHEEQTGQKVEIDHAGSGELLIRIQQTQIGDLYVCHDPFLGRLMHKRLGVKGWVVGYIKPMIAVQKGNPKNIEGLKDLLRGDVRLGLTDPTYSTTGWIYKIVFKKAGIAEQIANKDMPRTRGGGQTANNVKLGHLDAGIVWDAVIHARRDGLDAVDIEPEYRPQPEVDAVTTATFGTVDMSAIRVTVATLKCSKKLAAATKFAEFCTSPEARQTWVDFGFSAPPGKVGPVESAQKPAAGKRILLHCGAGIRPAVSKIIDAFTAQTGIEVDANYAGSGQLIASIRESRLGDLYMPGDIGYIEEAKKFGLAEEPHIGCYFVPVILVQKGNPKGIRSLADLARPGVKVALGNPKTCAIGCKCVMIFKKNGIDVEAVQRNVVFSSATVNELGVQIKTGHSDAAIVWDAMAAYFRDSADAVAIPTDQNIISTVAVSVLKCAKSPAEAQQFAEFVAGPRGKAIFQANHYTVETP